MTRHWILWSIAVRNVRRFAGRCLAVALPLWLVMSVATAILVTHEGLLKDGLLSLDGGPNITVRRILAGRSVPALRSWVKGFRALNGVKSVEPRIWGEVVTSSGSVYTLLGMDSAALNQKLQASLVQGNLLSPGQSGCAVVGQLVSREKNIRLGGSMFLSDIAENQAEFRVVGVFQDPAASRSAGLVLTDLESAADFFGYSKQECTDLWVEPKDPNAADSIATMLQLQEANLEVVTRAAQASELKNAYGRRAGLVQMLWLCLLLTAVLLAWSQASSVSMEMRREVGVLKALGWPTLDIIELKMLESTLVALGSIGLGLLTGVGFVAAGAPVLRDFYLGWSSYGADFPIPWTLSGATIFTLTTTGLVPLWLASIFPAWGLAILEPDRAIRSE